ncbi:MAG: Ig-like domain-containing protein [Deltaproteobacteria bacterium]|nr:Ig-like domain-containing protein [Deltaproteobacteria bacterium]
MPGVTFEWSSTSSTVATIDAAGVATGGPTAGTTQIRARVQSSIGPVDSAPVRLTNLGPPVAQQIRITVVRQDSGLPVAGAQVELHSPGPQSGVTDADGVVVFTQTGPAQAYSVTAAHTDYDWVTVLGASTPDLRLELPALSRTDRAAGAKGTVDLGQVTTQGALSLSLSGASLASPLYGSEPAQIFGGDIFNVSVPMVGNIPVPAGNTVAVEFMGFPFTLKDTFYTRAQPGLRALWSFGGRIDLGNSGLGLGDLQNLLAALLPFYQRFEHTVDPAVPMLAVPTVADTSDVNGNGDTTELVPNWSSFPSRTLAPHQAQNLRYSLTVDNLPFVSGGNANTLVVMSGVILPGVGFVPLGLDGQSDSQGNGIVQSFVTKMAPRHGGLEAGPYGVMVSAIRLDMGGLPGPGSVRLYTSDRLPTAVDLSDGWLDSPVDATFDGGLRQASLPTLPGADLYHLSFAGPEGTWHVYAAAAAGATQVDVPAAPAGLPDRAAGAAVTVDAVDLVPGADPATLFDAAAPGGIGLDRLTRGFSRAVVQ